MNLAKYVHHGNKFIDCHGEAKDIDKKSSIDDAKFISEAFYIL